MSERWLSKGSRRSAILLPPLLVAALAVAGCSDKAEEEAAPEPPAVLIEDGSDVPQIALTERAEERLGIAMGNVSGTPDALVVPYAAVFYTAEGDTWVYTSPAAQTYERTPIAVTWIENGLALLESGPAVGTEVVIVGGAELGGVEDGL